MSFPEDPTGTFEGRMGCPSELVLDRWQAGELSPRSTAEAEQHVAGCEICQQRMSVRRLGFDSFPHLDRSTVLERIRNGMAAARPPVPRAGWREHLWLALVPLCALLGFLAVRWLVHH
jgi:hypothetical protein